METIPTAEEVYFQFTKCIMNHRDIKIAMIEFAKLHVIEALKQASEKVTAHIEWIDEDPNTPIVNKESILNAYPLENIK